MLVSGTGRDGCADGVGKGSFDSDQTSAAPCASQETFLTVYLGDMEAFVGNVTLPSALDQVTCGGCTDTSCGAALMIRVLFRSANDTSLFIDSGVRFGASVCLMRVYPWPLQVMIMDANNDLRPDLYGKTAFECMSIS